MLTRDAKLGLAAHLNFLGPESKDTVLTPRSRETTAMLWVLASMRLLAVLQERLV